MKNRPFLNRLRFARTGIRAAFGAEASFRAQVYMALAAGVVLGVLRPPLIWVALCLLSAGAVLALELVNTALESLADRLHPEIHESIRMAKDCAAGAVLVASCVALVIGVLTMGIALGWLRH
jgi:undecaprenol kinase